MSRIGKQPIAIPDGVKIEVGKTDVKVTGKNGNLIFPLPHGIAAEYDDGARQLKISRASDSKQSRAMHGTTRSRVAGMVHGVSAGFVKELQIVGVGYQARLQGEQLVLQIGFCHAVEMDIPEGLTLEVPSNTAIKVGGADKQKVGQFAAEIRRVRPPEPYNGKGIKYRDEHIRRKQGKTFAGGD